MSKMKTYNILRKLFRVSVMLLALCAGVFSAGCASTTPKGIAERYQTTPTPEYQLVDSRFGTIELVSGLGLAQMEREILHLLHKTSCRVDAVEQDGPVSSIRFGRSGAHGRVTLALQPSERTDDLFRYRLTYRVNIARYPATVEQDYQVNFIADELANAVRQRDMFNLAAASNR
jgi:hypothetical protein